MQSLNWNDVRAFLAIAEAGQIGDAARRLGVDPTTLGRRLKRLEAHLDIRLLERTRVGQTLTEAGEQLLAKAEAMEQAARSIDESLGAREGIAGTLRLSVSEGFGSEFLTPYMRDFVEEHPALTVELVAHGGFLSPSKREADIAVMLSRPKAGPVLCQKLADYTLKLYASRDYLARHGTPGCPLELASEHRLVSYVPDLLYAPELNYLDEFHPVLTAQVRSSSINAQQRLVSEGVGIGVLPCFLGDKQDRLVPVCPATSIVRSFWIVTHRDTQNLARVRAGKDWLKRCVAAGRTRLMPDSV